MIESVIAPFNYREWALVKKSETRKNKRPDHQGESGLWYCLV
jgi:hypothetical protein